MSTAISHAKGTDRRLGFTSQEEEVAVDSLPVEGELPAWLTGALIRVTPAKLDVGERRVDHWFDGLATLNRFGFGDGRVSYRSRLVQSRALAAAREGRVRAGLRHRSLPVDLQAGPVDLLARARRTTRTSTWRASGSATSR